jgi:hypothetical protein
MPNKKTLTPVFLFLLSSSLVATTSVRAGDLEELTGQAADNYEAIQQGTAITTESKALVEDISKGPLHNVYAGQAWVSPRWSAGGSSDAGCNPAGHHANTSLTRISVLNISSQAASVAITYYYEEGAVAAIEDLGFLQPGSLGVHVADFGITTNWGGAGWVKVVANQNVLVDGSIQCRYQASRAMTWYPYPES